MPVFLTTLRTAKELALPTSYTLGGQNSIDLLTKGIRGAVRYNLADRIFPKIITSDKKTAIKPVLKLLEGNSEQLAVVNEKLSDRCFVSAIGKLLFKSSWRGRW